MPTVSVVIPSYNVERYVGAAIESALSQTYDDLEVVVVNDGSTDGTATAIEPFRSDPRVVYVAQENRGLAGARNRGIREAHGEYIGLLDADDLWMPERLTRCVEILAASPEIGWVTTDCFLLEDETPTTKRYYVDVLHRAPEEECSLQQIARANCFFVGGVIRRELFDRLGGFDESLRRAEDYEMWIRLMLGGVRAACVPEPLAWYRVRADSLSADNAAQWDAHLTVLERHLPELTARGAPGPAREAHDIARRLAARGDHKGAARFARMAARDPEITLGRRLKLEAIAARMRLGARH